MTGAVVDFNPIASGLVRGLQEDADDELVVGATVLLTDGEGNEALGTVQELRDGLVFAAVDWETFGPSGVIKPVSLRPAACPKTTTFEVTGSVWKDLSTDRASERIEGAAERVFAA
jgi:hypothetical protein